MEDGEDEADNDGDELKLEDAVLVIRRLVSIIPNIGDVPGTPGGTAEVLALGWIFMTPAATELPTGITTAFPV